MSFDSVSRKQVFKIQRVQLACNAGQRSVLSASFDYENVRKFRGVENSNPRGRPYKDDRAN